MEIPQDLNSLKRPILQSLCKSHGVKANGKNTDMIRALEQIRDKTHGMQGNENVSASTQVSYDDPLLCTTELPTMITSPAVEKLQAAKKVNKKSKKGGKRGGGKRRKRSDQNETKNETAQEKTEAAEGNSLLQLSTQHSPQTSNSVIEVAKTSSPDLNKTVSRKRKRRDTYSVSPNSSLCSKAKMARFDSPIDGTPIKGKYDATHLPSPPVSADEPSVKLSSLNNPHNVTTEVSSSSDEMNVEAHPLFSPPSSTNKSNLSGSRKRKRHSTFTISSPEETCDVTSIDQTTPEGVSGERDLETPTEKCKRRSTFEIPSAELNMTGEAVTKLSNVEATNTDSTKVDQEENIMAELQNILDKKVSERKADPNYMPVHSIAASIASRLPVKTKTQKKFDRAHGKQFKRMKSIVSCQEERKRKSSVSKLAPSCAKRPRLSENRTTTTASRLPTVSKHPIKSKNVTIAANTKTEASKKHSLTSKKTSASQASVKSRVSTGSSVFKPTVTSTKKANFRFLAKKSSGTQYKTPKKTFTFTGIKTPAMTSKSVYNLDESIKKKPSYKIHKGPLPKFESSHY